MATSKELRQKKERRIRRMRRTRARIRGTSSKPRLSLFRSNKHLFAQIIDDGLGKTVLGMGDYAGKEQKGKKQAGKEDAAYAFGKKFGEAARGKGIRKVVFDRSHYAYHGKVKAFVQGAREGGLEF